MPAPALRLVRSHVRSAADCDDIIQNVAVVQWGKFETYRPDESFAHWALGIARLEVLKHREKQDRRTVSLQTELLDLVAKETLEISEKAELLGEAMRKCVKKLSPWSRVVLKQRFEAGNRDRRTYSISCRTVGPWLISNPCAKTVSRTRRWYSTRSAGGSAKSRVQARETQTTAAR